MSPFSRGGLIPPRQSPRQRSRGHSNATPPKPVSMPLVKSRPALSSERKQRNVGSHYAGAIDASLLVLEELAQAAPRVHPAGQTVIGTAKEREVVFDGAEQRAGCVLPLRSAFAKPA